MVSPSKVAEQAVANNWLTIVARSSMIICAFSLPVVWNWAGKVERSLASLDTAVQLLQKEDQSRRDASARNQSDLLAMSSRISLLEIDGGRADAQQQAMQDGIREILARIARIEEGLGRRGEIPWPDERAEVR